MNDLTVSFGGDNLHISLGEHTDLALEAAARAEAALAQGLSTYNGIARSGSIADREAIPLDQRKRGLTFKVTQDASGLFQEWREYEWRLAGDRDGPTREGAFLTAPQWCFLWTERERQQLDLIPFKGALPSANVAELPSALLDIQAASRVRLGDFRAILLSTGVNPKARLSWSQYGLKPDSQIVSWNGYSIPLDGGVTELETSDWSAPLPLFIYGNSLSDITDVTTRWSQVLAASLGVGLNSVARYSSDVRQVKRAGLEPLMLTIGSTLPAGGTYANVTHIDGLAVTDPTFLSSPQSILNTGDPSVVTGVSMGGLVLVGAEVRHATLSISNAAATNYRIVQDAGQPALALTGPVQFVPDVALARAGSRSGIWVGQNYYYSGVPNSYGDHTNPQMFIDIAKMVGATKGGPAFILPIIPDASWPAEGSPIGPIDGVEYGFRGRAAMAAANARLEALYPNLYLRNSSGQDLNAWLQAHGNGSANDNADIAAGYTPRSLRLSGDGLHLNAAGDALVAQFVEDALAVQDTPPEITDQTSFSLVATGTQQRQFPEDPIVSMDSAVTRATTGFEAQLAAQISGALTSSAYYPTLSQAINDLDVGSYFNSDDQGNEGPHAGIRWIYEVTAEAPFYEAVREWAKAADVGLSNVDNTSDAQKVASGPVAEALDIERQKGVNLALFGAVLNDISKRAQNRKAIVDAQAMGHSRLFVPGTRADLLHLDTQFTAGDLSSFLTIYDGNKIEGGATICPSHTGLTLGNKAESDGLSYDGSYMVSTGFSLVRAHAGTLRPIIRTPFIGNAPKNGVAFDSCPFPVIEIIQGAGFGNMNVAAPTEGAAVYLPNADHPYIRIVDGSGSWGSGFIILTNPTGCDIEGYIHDTRYRALSSGKAGTGSTGPGNRARLKVQRTGYLNKGSVARTQGRVIDYATYADLWAARPALGTIGFAFDEGRYYERIGDAGTPWQGNGVGTNMVYVGSSTNIDYWQIDLQGEDQGENFLEGTLTALAPVCRNNDDYDADLFTPTPGGCYGRIKFIGGGNIENYRGPGIKAGGTYGVSVDDIDLAGGRFFDPRPTGLVGFPPCYVLIEANGPDTTVAKNITVKGCKGRDRYGVVTTGYTVSRAGGLSFDPASVSVRENECTTGAPSLSSQLTNVANNSWQAGSDPFDQKSGTAVVRKSANVAAGGNKRVFWGWGIDYDTALNAFTLTSGVTRLLMSLDNDNIRFYVIPSSVAGGATAGRLTNSELDTYFRGYFDQTGMHAGGAAYNSIRKLWLGTSKVFWRDAAGRLRVSDTDPASDTAGQAASTLVGTTAQRPTVFAVGDPYFDTSLNKPIWRGNAGWVDASGATV